MLFVYALQPLDFHKGCEIFKGIDKEKGNHSGEVFKSETTLLLGTARVV